MNDLPAWDREVPGNVQVLLFIYLGCEGCLRSTEVVTYFAFVLCLLQGLIWGGYFGDTIHCTEVKDQDFPSGSPHTQA